MMARVLKRLAFFFKSNSRIHLIHLIHSVLSRVNRVKEIWRALERFSPCYEFNRPRVMRNIFGQTYQTNANNLHLTQFIKIYLSLILFVRERKWKEFRKYKIRFFFYSCETMER